MLDRKKSDRGARGKTRKQKKKTRSKKGGKRESSWVKTDPGTTYPRFLEECGPTLSLPYNFAPEQFFNQVYPPRLIDLLVEQTNLYAAQRRVAGWEDTTEREMIAFLGFVMATSIHRVPQFNNIWSSDWVLGVPALASIFPRKRFWQLWTNLHLVDNTQAPDRSEPSFDRLYKLRPLLTILGQSFRGAYKPAQQISVDEAMVKFKGRSSLKQYMPMKPIKRGFKIWCLCDANGGYLQEFQIYTGKEYEMVNTHK